MPREKYCICRKGNFGQMIGCDKCFEWYHYKCLGITSVAQDKDWFCPICIKEAKRCHNPKCCNEARGENSKYCSDSCGLEFNRERYRQFFLPKWEQLVKQHSKVRIDKMDELERLENELEEVKEIIGRLKRERDELEQNINIVKEQARVLGAEANQNKEQQREDSDEDEEEENIISDQSKFFCPACGLEPTADKYFKHLINCYKKQEGSFVSYLTAPIQLTCDTDKEPNIYCTKMVDKKKGWHCPNIAVICPTHSNYNNGPDEICGSPLIDAQDTIVPDGNYCLKLKRDCTSHYNWDRFRLASKDFARAEAFQRLNRILDDIARTQSSLNTTYGGVVGIMLHNTIDHKIIDETEEDEEVDMQF